MPASSFDNLAAFIAMDGHGFYVWLCVALALMVVATNVLLLRFARQRFLRGAAARARRRQAPATEAGVLESAANLLEPEAST